MTPECVPCLIRRVLFEAEEVEGSDAVKAVKNASKTLGKLFNQDVCSATVASQVHRETYKLLGTTDPYAKLKKRANEIALGLYPTAEKYVERSRNPLRDAFLCSVVGNVLDSGIEMGFDNPEKLAKEFRHLLAEGLRYDDTEKIKGVLKKADHVVYLGDNCGEIVLDRLALKELKKFYIHLTLVVKEKAILTDATLKDIEGLGMEYIVDDIVEAPGFAVGLDLDSLRGEFGRMMEEADLIIAKGMGNFEALSETDLSPIAYLLRTKCRPVSNAIRLPRNINAVKLVSRRGRAR